MNADLNKKIQELCEQSGITYAGMFGSFSRGDFNEKSDVDLLVNYSYPLSLLEKGSLIVKLEALFGRDVDLVSAKNVKNNRKSFIMKDLKTIYEKR